MRIDDMVTAGPSPRSSNGAIRRRHRIEAALHEVAASHARASLLLCAATNDARISDRPIFPWIRGDFVFELFRAFILPASDQAEAGRSSRVDRSAMDQEAVPK